jgi:type IV secretory pathway TrbD component
LSVHDCLRTSASASATAGTLIWTVSRWISRSGLETSPSTRTIFVQCVHYRMPKSLDS